jgi:hypothetical protein
MVASISKPLLLSSLVASQCNRDPGVPRKLLSQCLGQPNSRCLLPPSASDHVDAHQNRSVGTGRRRAFPQKAVSLCERGALDRVLPVGRFPEGNAAMDSSRARPQHEAAATKPKWKRSSCATRRSMRAVPKPLAGSSTRLIRARPRGFAGRT